MPNTHAIPYTLKRRARMRAVRVRVTPGGTVFVSAPARVSTSMIDLFVSQNRSWIIRAQEKLKDISPLVLKGSRREYFAHKARALVLAQELLERCNARYRFTYRRISIRNQKTRWGSCSKAGNLSFNYKIVLLPRPLAEYLVVHELCHLKEHNHSARFWALVGETIPELQRAPQ